MKTIVPGKSIKLSELLEKVSAEKFWKDEIPLDQLMIENKRCPKCKNFLSYRGFSATAEYHAFGVCEPCNYALKFWTEKIALMTAKKRLAAAKV